MFLRRISAFLALLAAVLHLTPAPAAQKCAPAVTGSFLQAWYCVGWDDARWDAETAWMKQAGLEYLVLQTAAYLDENGGWQVNYDSALPVFAAAEKADVLSGALKSCRKAGIKVFVGLADFADWWNLGGLSPQYQTVCGVMTQMQREIWQKYRPQYGETLYGWYFAPEINNVLLLGGGLPSIPRGLNRVLETATALEPSMPVMLSPYFSEAYALGSVTATLPLWQSFFAQTRFRPGDIFCPQDAVGAGWTSEKNLEKVWRMYAAAVEGAEKGVRLWANCENFTADHAPALIDRFARQLSAACRYAENIVCFSMNHYYSPFADAAAWGAYLRYAEGLR